LVYKPTSEIVIDTIVCDSLVLNGVTYTTSGTKEQHFTNAVGCDSMLTINLTVLESTFETINRTVCDQVTINNSTYTQSGRYIQHLTNAAGCDSTLTINLTVNESSELTLNETHCDSYELNGITYTESGTYTIRSENESGCTLIITLNLTILDPVELTSDASDLTVECDGNGNLEDLNNWLQTIGGTGAAQAGFGTINWTNDFEGLTPGCCNTGSVLVTFTAYDECQNSVSTSATFTIVDSEAPAFTAPEDITIYSGEECQYDASIEVTGDVTDESDACCPELDATYTDVVEQGACAGEWVITRTWNLADACENQAEAQVQVITVMDTVAPVAVCNNITIQLGSNGMASITVDDLNGGSTDNCGIDTVFISQYDFVCGDLGTNEVTLTVFDNCGNTSTCTAEVTVEAGDVDCGQEKLIAQPDVLTLVVCPGGIVNGSINLLTNDEGIGTSGVTLSADNIPDNVQVNLTDGELLYANEIASEAVIQFTYTICSNANPENCSTAEVTIHIQLDTDCDGVPDVIDIDDDDDGILDIHEMEFNNTTGEYEDIDTDQDGVVNRLDIDSDGDGIPDNIEWQQTATEITNHPDYLEVEYILPSGIDANGNGWDDAYDSEMGGTYYDAFDTDLNGVPDYLDSDSDGDGLSDLIEGSDSDFDNIADVQPLGIDSDGDGLDDAFDTYNTNSEWLNGKNAIGSNVPLEDENENGIRDWREIDPIGPPLPPEAEGCELFIPNGFSPNGDTYNDYFEIIFTCETGDLLFEAEYPDAKIEIFNRWGNKVYERENYGNTQRWSYQDAWWDGKSTNKMQVGRDNLPTATYFYILYLGDGSKPITGTIFLNN
ncbi:MAG: gliding motility-associated C-terminal domain-containing protein, partial [Draconibacterium sp.]